LFIYVGKNKKKHRKTPCLYFLLRKEDSMKSKILALVLLLAGVVIAGCNQPVTPNQKQARLIVLENAQLKKDVARLEKDLEKQRNLLEQTNKELQKWKEQARKNVRDQVKDVLDNVIEENAQLHQQITKLQTEIDALKAKTN
jgi:hypothetical protein